MLEGKETKRNGVVTFCVAVRLLISRVPYATVTTVNVTRAS